MGNSGRPPRRTRRCKRRVGRESAGVKAQRDGWNRDSWPYEFSPLMVSSVGTTAQGSLVTDRMAGVGKGTDQVLPLRSARHLYTATISTAGEVSLEDRARLPATEGGTGTGSLRRAELDWLAPPHDASYVGSRISYSGNAPQQKKLLGGPCHGRVVKFNTCSSPGQVSVPTAEQKQSAHEVPAYLT